jgi:hypothetical protein
VDGSGGLIGEGRGTNGVGEGVRGDGEQISYASDGNLLGATFKNPGSGPDCSRQVGARCVTDRWTSDDGKNSAEVTTDTVTGAFSAHSETTADDGSKLVVDAAGDQTGGTRRARTYDPQGNVINEEITVEGVGEKGTRSSATRIIDANGNETIITVTTAKDGSTHTHKSFEDSKGNRTKDDEESDTPPTNPSSGDEDNSEPEEEQTSDNKDGRRGNAGDPAADPDEGDGEGTGRGPTIGSIGGPALPGGSLARILKGFGAPSEGESGDQDAGHAPTARQVQRIIEASHHAGPGGGTGDETDGVGNGAHEVMIPVPKGAMDDWSEHPRPNTVSRFASWILDRAGGLNSAGLALKQGSTAMRIRRKSF